jgi:hypothetical protein
VLLAINEADAASGAWSRGIATRTTGGDPEVVAEMKAGQTGHGHNRRARFE